MSWAVNDLAAIQFPMLIVLGDIFASSKDEQLVGCLWLGIMDNYIIEKSGTAQTSPFEAQQSH